MADKIKTATNLDGKINPSNTWRALDIPFHPYDRPPAKHRFQPNTKNPKVGTSGIFSYQLSIAAGGHNARKERKQTASRLTYNSNGKKEEMTDRRIQNLMTGLNQRCIVKEIEYAVRRLE